MVGDLDQLIYLCAVPTVAIAKAGEDSHHFSISRLHPLEYVLHVYQSGISGQLFHSVDRIYFGASYLVCGKLSSSWIICI